MKLFACPGCAEVVFFENTKCVHCGSEIAYDPDADEFRLLASASVTGKAASLPGAAIRACRNRVDHDACNWAVPAAEENPYCLACRLNEIIPDLTNPAARAAWIRLEGAKRRLLYTLRRLDLPVIARSPQSPDGVAFAFKQDGVTEEKVITGHADGLITINIAEADDASRETIRGTLGEPYRTVLGHFRHEIGHYYWDRLIKEGDRLAAFREVFGDEQLDYEQALQRYYEAGAPADWSSRHISAYASAHPWEDWAETWAHYLHMVDGVETTRAFGLTLRPDGPGRKPLPALTVRRASDESFDALLTTWMPVTVALNSFTRGMGLSDVYPFVLSEPAIAKLRFVHHVVRDNAESDRAPSEAEPTAAAIGASS
jgi:hypothetical protein